MSDKPPLLVTSALPYANGPIHLGHMVENTQSDIFVRFNRLVGRDVLYVCAADTHGTPIEVNARKQGIEPAQMVETWRVEHARDFADFDVAFETYYSTNSDENRRYAERVYLSLKEKGHVFEKSVEQFYCEKDERFLPDRFVKGTCPNPKCGAEDQYGDVCEVCSKTHDPTDLKKPYCSICGTPPVRRKSVHHFVQLADFTDFLTGYIERLQPEVKNYVSTWVKDGLAAWDISRDGPYFGFEIPDAKNKFFYVWLDAPIGYISAASHACKELGKDLARYWPGTLDASRDEGAPAEIVHFIGKDIVYFHTLFWPVMLEASGFQVPDRIHVHGMLNFGGAKMSKSRGRMITAREWLNAFDPSYLRYYLAANLGPSLDDIEFSTEELRNRVNSHLVNNIGNLVNRALSFTSKRFEGKLSAPTALSDEQRAEIDGYITKAKAAYEELNYRDAVRQIESLASWANEFMQSAAPWKSIKTEPAKAQADVTLVANIARVLGTLLLPIVPRFSHEIFVQLAVDPPSWDEGVKLDLVDHAIGDPKPLLPPIDVEALEALFAPKEKAAPQSSPKPESPKVEALSEEIDFDAFMKVDVRVGLVKTAERIPKADKLLKLTVDIGEEEPRVVAAGIAKSYEPEQLVGLRVAVVANLAPRKIRGVESRGMLLAASTGEGLVLLDVPGESMPGTRIK